MTGDEIRAKLRLRPDFTVVDGHYSISDIQRHPRLIHLQRRKGDPGYLIPPDMVPTVLTRLNNDDDDDGA